MNRLSATCLRLSLLSSLTVSAWAAEKPLRTFNLEQIGYQRVSCEVNWQGEDSYAKRQIEFLDNEHLLVHYASSEVCKSPRFQYPEQGLHSAVIDLSGGLLHTYDWRPSEDVIAGPDGHILVVAPDAVRIVDLNFHTLQTISWHEERSPSPRFRALITPSRHGFAIVGLNRASLYIGSPYLLTATTADLVTAATDRGFITLSGFDPGPPTLHVDGVVWPRPARPSLNPCAAMESNEVLGLDHKFNLYRIDQRGGEVLIAHLGSLAPGMWNSGFRFDLALPDARRMLFFSYGARIAFSDTSGIWKYFRSAVLDLKTNQFVFHYDGHFDDDVSLSPDGHFVAAREMDHLSIYSVP